MRSWNYSKSFVNFVHFSSFIQITLNDAQAWMYPCTTMNPNWNLSHRTLVRNERCESGFTMRPLWRRIFCTDVWWWLALIYLHHSVWILAVAQVSLSRYFQYVWSDEMAWFMAFNVLQVETEIVYPTLLTKIKLQKNIREWKWNLFFFFCILYIQITFLFATHRLRIRDSLLFTIFHG